MRISVIVPAYNCGPYLPECLDSIINQTYPVYEIILVDDGSTDNTLSVIKRYKNSYPGLITSIAQENKGAAAARNVALDQVTGDYIAFIDGDDFIWPDYFERLIFVAQEKDADVVTCGYQKFIDGSNEIIETRDPVAWDISFGDKSHVFQYSPCAKLIDAKLLLDNNLRFGEGEVMEDCPFGIITNSVCQNNVAISYYGYRYRRHDGSVQDGVRKEGLKEEENDRPFPYNGIREAIIKVRDVKGDTYDKVLEYIVSKALAGFVYSFSKNSSKKALKFTCKQCKDIIDDYFDDIQNNPFIRLSSPADLPVVHRFATYLFAFSVRHNVLYPTARFVQLVERLIGKGAN